MTYTVQTYVSYLPGTFLHALKKIQVMVEYLALKINSNKINWVFSIKMYLSTLLLAAGLPSFLLRNGSTHLRPAAVMLDNQFSNPFVPVSRKCGQLIPPLQCFEGQRCHHEHNRQLNVPVRGGSGKSVASRMRMGQYVCASWEMVFKALEQKCHISIIMFQ